MESPKDTELLQQFETGVEAVEAGRKALETAFEEAMKSGDYSRFNELQRTVKASVYQAERIQRKLSGETFDPIILAEYKYKDEKGKESTESITLNFETELANWSDFYTQHGLTLPEDFAEKMQDIWERNAPAMEKEITEKGFDKVVFIPASVDDINLKKLEEEMTKGYKEEAKKAGKPVNDTYFGIDTTQVINSRTGDRIVLLHSVPDLTAQPELLKTLDKKYGGEKADTVDNKAQDFIDLGEQMTIPEWFILQREIWEKTGVYIDGKITSDGNYIICPWLPGSRMGTEAGSGVLRASWDPDRARVFVDAYSPGLAYPAIGCRLSRCFD